MRSWINLVESTDDDEVDRIISAAAFTEHECDTGISGLCGTFALALHDVLIERTIPCTIGFICARDMDYEIDKPIIRNGNLFWRHVVVQAHGEYYDIEGRNTKQAMIDNYLWQRPAMIVEFDREASVGQINQVRYAWDAHSYADYVKRLSTHA